MTVRKLRLERGWTQEQLAELSGLSVRSIQRIERGETCSLETKNSLASVFGVERSTFDHADAAIAKEDSLAAEEILAIAYVKGHKDFFCHSFLYIFFVLIVGFMFGIDHPLMLWGSIGWGAGVVGHGLAAFEVVNIFSPEWEKRMIERHLGRQFRIQYTRPGIPRLDARNASVCGISVQIRSMSMKIFSRVSGSMSAIVGIALLAWVSYDATNVMQSLGLESRMDEATVALASLLLGALFLAFGVYSWRRAGLLTPVKTG